jgi:hypothetical protein
MYCFPPIFLCEIQLWFSAPKTFGLVRIISNRDGYHRRCYPVAVSYERIWNIAAQGTLCPCATNKQIKTRQGRRFAQAALKSCGSLE